MVNRFSMDHKKSPKGKKRASKQFEDTLWECSACTYRNNPEAFKCSMCGIRKGTSTRKPKLNPDMLEVQVQKHAFAPPPMPHSRLLRDEPVSKSGDGAGSSKADRGGGERPSSSASNDAGDDDYDEPGPSTATPKNKKLKLPPVPKGKNKPGASSSSNNGVTGTPHIGSVPVIGRGGRIRNLDRKSATVHDISVDDVTITITEYRLKPPRKERKGTAALADGEGTSSAAGGNHSDAESDSQDTRTT